MSELPLVSALVCTYNYGRFLPRALDSALAQDYPPDLLEIVVVDDGSTDATPEILADYAARYPRRIKAFRQPNGGLAAATERAVAEAGGDLLAFLDADDIWPERKIRDQVAIMAARPEVGLVYSDMELIDESDRVLVESWWGMNGQQPHVGRDCYLPLISGGNPIVASSIMVRSALRERIMPMPRQPIFVDWWVAAQAAMVSELAVVDTFRVGYRKHDSNTTLAVSSVSATMRERTRAGSTRRATLARGGAAVLPIDRIGWLWSLIEWDAMQAVKKFGTAFVEFPQPDSEDRRVSAELGARATRLQTRGRDEEALRTWLAAAGINPYNHVARGRVVELGARFTGAAGGAEDADSPGALDRRDQLGVLDRRDPLEPARSFVVFTTLAGLEREPALLGRFADQFTDADQATLYVYAPEVDASELEQRFVMLLDKAAIDPDRGPDVVVQGDDEGLLDLARLRAAADAELSAGSLAGLRGVYELLTSPLPAGRDAFSVTEVCG